jgi:aminoglycoside 6'-N-acetyltransferase
MMVIFENENIKVRKLKEQDAILLMKWLNNPSVLEFYEGRDNPHDLDMVLKSFFKSDNETRCIVEYDDTTIGYIQFYPVDNEEKLKYGYSDFDGTIYGTDQFIGEVEYWNRGIGKTLVRSMVDYLINVIGADKVVMDPQIWNKRAIACYEKSGFKKIKLLPKNEWHEGELRDSWLMEYSKRNLSR